MVTTPADIAWMPAAVPSRGAAPDETRMDAVELLVHDLDVSGALTESHADQLRSALHEHLVLFFDMPGLTREQMDEQLEVTAAEVLPRLGVVLG